MIYWTYDAEPKTCLSSRGCSPCSHRLELPPLKPSFSISDQLAICCCELFFNILWHWLKKLFFLILLWIIFPLEGYYIHEVLTSLSVSRPDLVYHALCARIIGRFVSTSTTSTVTSWMTRSTYLLQLCWDSAVQLFWLSQGFLFSYSAYSFAAFQSAGGDRQRETSCPRMKFVQLLDESKVRAKGEVTLVKDLLETHALCL